MSTTPGTEAEDPGPGKRRRPMIILIVVAIIAGIALAAAGWYYFYGGTAPDAPSIDNALQQLLPSEPPE